MGRSCTKCDKKHYAKDLCKNHYESSDEYKRKRNEKKYGQTKRAKEYQSNYHKKNRDNLLLKMRERRENFTPEQIESERLRSKQRTANGEFKNENKTPEAIEKDKLYGVIWRKNNPTYHSKWTKENPNSVQKALRKYEETHVEERRIQRAKHPEWQVQYPYTISSKISDILDIPHSEIAHKINTKNNECKIRDNFTCQICESKENLIAHHIFYKSKYPKLTLNINNLITLCKYCHNQIHWNKWTRKSFIMPKVYFKIIY